MIGKRRGFRIRSATQNSSSTGTAISVAAPTGTTTGDLVKVIVHGNGQTTIVDNNHTVSGSNLTSFQSSTDATSYSTASITPTANYLVLASVTSSKGTTPDTPTLSGNGLTWVQIATNNFDSTGTQRTITLFRAMGSSPSNGAVTADFGGATQTACTIIVDQFSGVDTSGTNGSGAIVQSATNAEASQAANDFTVTLAAFSSANNATYGVASNGDAANFTVGTGFTTLGGSSTTTPIINTRSEWRADNDTTVTFGGAIGYSSGGIAVEIKANSGFTEQIDDYKPNTTNGHTMSVFSRVIQAGDPTTYNFTLGASGRWAAVAICATDTSTPQDDVAPSTTNAGNRDSAGDGNATTASITTGVDNAAHIIVAGWDTGAIGTITTPSGYTLLANANSGGQPTHVAYKVITSAGATGTTTPTNTEFAAYITFSFSIKAAGGTSYTPTYTETLTLVDSIPRSISRTLTDVETLVDVLNKSTSRTLTDTKTLVDTVLKSPSRIVLESVTLVDTITRSISRTLTDVKTLVDTYTRVWNTSRTLTEEVPLVDTSLKSTSRTLQDSQTLVDSIIFSTGKLLTEAISLIDVLNKSVSRTLIESVVFVDSIIRALNRTLSDLFTLVDTFISDVITTSYSKILTETLTLVDSAEKLFNHIISGIPTTIRHLAQIRPFGFLKDRKPAGTLDDIKPEGSSDRGIESGISLKDKNKPSMM